MTERPEFVATQIARSWHLGIMARKTMDDLDHESGIFQTETKVVTDTKRAYALRMASWGDPYGPSDRKALSRLPGELTASQWAAVEAATMSAEDYDVWLVERTKQQNEIERSKEWAFPY